jgi:hypothetical protein
MRLLSWLLWVLMMVFGLAALLGSLAHGRTPATMGLLAVTMLTLVLGVAVDRRRGAL